MFCVTLSLWRHLGMGVAGAFAKRRDVGWQRLLGDHNPWSRLSCFISVQKKTFFYGLSLGQSRQS
jgi:hypothetical protein